MKEVFYKTTDNYLEHRSHKYIKRERVNGKYVYTYPEDLKKSIGKKMDSYSDPKYVKIQKRRKQNAANQKKIVDTTKKVVKKAYKYAETKTKMYSTKRTLDKNNKELSELKRDTKRLTKELNTAKSKKAEPGLYNHAKRQLYIKEKENELEYVKERQTELKKENKKLTKEWNKYVDNDSGENKKKNKEKKKPSVDITLPDNAVFAGKSPASKSVGSSSNLIEKGKSVVERNRKLKALEKKYDWVTSASTSGNVYYMNGKQVSKKEYNAYQEYLSMKNDAYKRKKKRRKKVANAIGIS